MSEASRVLEAAGVPADESRRDAALLARWILAWDEADWLTRRQEETPPGFPARLEALIARRQRREPVAYILGQREFYGRPFIVTPAVLIPRPETELVIDEALEKLPRGAGTTVIDVGTGSGCLAVTLARERSGIRVVAIDVSSEALAVALENARCHGVLERVEFRQGHLLDGVSAPVDMIVSNPPYVAERERASLAPEVLEHEPAGALFAGADGLDVIRALVSAAASVLAPGGALIFEFGWEQANEVRRIVASSGLALQEIHRDLQNLPRVATVLRPVR